MTDRIKEKLDGMEIPSPENGFESRIVLAGVNRKRPEPSFGGLSSIFQTRALFSGSLAVVLGMFILIFIGPSFHRSDVDKGVLNEIFADDWGLDDFNVFDEDEFLF